MAAKCVSDIIMCKYNFLGLTGRHSIVLYSSYAPTVKSLAYARERAVIVNRVKLKEKAIIISMPTTPEQENLQFVKTEVKHYGNALSQKHPSMPQFYRILQDQRCSLSFLNTPSFISHVMDLKRMILLRAVCSSRTGKINLSRFRISHR